MPTRSAPPTMAPWNLSLRFGLELGALTALALAGWAMTSGSVRPAVAIVTPLAVATLWAVFNVIDDPSRSGSAPVEVRGWMRLALEVGILGAGAGAFVLAGHRSLAVAFVVMLVVHYVASGPRLRWLLEA